MIRAEWVLKRDSSTRWKDMLRVFSKTMKQDFSSSTTISHYCTDDAL